MIFYLGTHLTAWLSRSEVPLFISRRRLAGVKKLPQAKSRWALDSGGFSELSMYGAWTTTPEVYVEEVTRFDRDIGSLDWAAVQDWMCEPPILKKTGKSVAEHQTLTIDNYLTLKSLKPDYPWVPVLQGWAMDDYLRHRDMYSQRGVALEALSTVGIGSVCRRQGTKEVEVLIRQLASDGLRLHGFGFKKKGLPGLANVLESADSLAWSYVARREKLLLPGCEGHRNCANCFRFAMGWREQLVSSLVL